MVKYGALSCDNFQVVFASAPIIATNTRTKYLPIPALLKCGQHKCGEIWRLHANRFRQLSPTLRTGIQVAAAGSNARTNGSVASGQVKENDVALVWFKHDLRTDDHPGLVEASQYTTVVPVYVFDQYICSRMSTQMLEMLIDAVQNLKQSLKDYGSDLIIRYGKTDDILLALVKEVKATHIIIEEEGEYDWLKLVRSFSESLSTVYVSGESPKVISWQAHLFEFENWKEISDSYREFQKMRCSSLAPLSCSNLPDLQLNVERGLLPEINNLRESVKGTSFWYSNWQSVKSVEASSILEVGQLDIDVKDKTRKNQTFREELAQKKQPTLSSNEAVKERAIRGGTTMVLNALDGYLRYLESTWREDWQEVHDRVWPAETRQGASFRTLFGCAMSLGTISRRRVYYEALKYERQRNAGWLSPLGFSAFTIAAAAEDAKSMEWYWLLALKSREEGIKKGWSVRTWRWRGYLIQYTVVGDEGPAVVLVHGFGAFWEHYRDNIFGIAKTGCRVWAITLLGFGRSEKPNIVYTELLWVELLRDFIVDVVGEPAHIVSNSFGGYLVSLVARLWPALAKSLVLCNTAGNVVPKYSSVRYLEPNPNSAVSWWGSRFLLLYLRAMAGRLLKKYYPTNPERADDWLLGELLRASYDPDVVVVLESIVDLRLSLPLNYLLDLYNKKVLVIQGDKDPLYQSKSRVTMLKQHCNTVAIRDVNAGHCPHDEIPDEVNSIILDWIKQIEACVVTEDIAVEGAIL